MEKKIRIWKRVVYSTLGVCMLGTIVWYVWVVLSLLSGMTREQIVKSVDISIFFTHISAYKDFTIVNAPVLFGLLCIVVVILVQGVSHIMLTQNQEETIRKP